MNHNQLKIVLRRQAVILSLICCFFGFVSQVKGQSQIFTIHHDSLINNKAETSLIKTLWLYHSGDDLRLANPQFQDYHLKPVFTNFGETNPLAGWKGIGWFRLRIKADSSLAGKILALRINHDGVSEVYIDGKFKGGFGEIGSSKIKMKAVRAPFELIPFQLNDTLPHLIAIRYANYNHIFPDFTGFQVWIGEYGPLHALTQHNKELFLYMLLSVAAQLALTILHLFLFICYPKYKLNLYYCLFNLFYLGTNLAVCNYNMTSNPFTQYNFQIVFGICCVFGTLTGWFLLYQVGNKHIAKWKTIVILIIGVLYLLKYIFFPISYPNDGFSLFFLLVTLDGLWALYYALKRQQQGVWLIGLGIVLVALFFFFAGADVFGLWSNYPERCLTMSIGLLSFPICFSMYLALDFARTNESLSLKLKQVEELSVKTLAQETEKVELITSYAEKLEETVVERTAVIQQQADQLREMDRIKSRFFINLTHEFRTPLTLILGPVQQILSSVKDTLVISHAATIYRNADRLLQLINQLLDLSKLEAGKMELNNTNVELIALCKRICSSFETLADEKQLSLSFVSDLESLWVDIDQDKLEKILYNLLSNAIKFTAAKGEITLMLNIYANHAEWFDVTVNDTGAGIPEEKLPYIFDRFYQVNPSDTRTQEGTGIGLAITKELTGLMGGTLSLKSEEEKGTEIKIILPLNLSNVMEVQPGTEDKFMLPDVAQLPLLDDDLTLNAGFLSLPLSAKDLPLVLIIEDNAELRSYMRIVLAGTYRVIDASNGEQGVNTCIEYIPDLIITDLMMPLMDGYQVCASLKANEKTSHIPVVILTAKADTESRITGMETHADAYLGKPFNERELLAVIDNLIALRRQLRERYAKDNIWLTDTADIPSMEKMFLDRVRKAVESHLDDEQYSVERLGEEIGLSRTQLHRKLKVLIDQSPGDLIRIIRLQRAYELLKNKAGNVSEVAYMVGFGNPKNFSTSFSKYFGFSPSEAKNK